MSMDFSSVSMNMTGGIQGPPQVESFDANSNGMVSSEELLSFDTGNDRFSDVLAKIAKTAGDDGLSYEELQDQLEVNKPQGPPPPTPARAMEEASSLFASLLYGIEDESVSNESSSDSIIASFQMQLEEEQGMRGHRPPPPPPPSGVDELETYADLEYLESISVVL